MKTKTSINESNPFGASEVPEAATPAMENEAPVITDFETAEDEAPALDEDKEEGDNLFDDEDDDEYF